MSNCEKEIIQKIQSISGRYSVYQIFDDWIHLLALEISIAVDMRTAKERLEMWKAIHEKYKELMKGYKETVRSEIFSEILSRGMNGLLERKRAGESIVRIPARAEQEL